MGACNACTSRDDDPNASPRPNYRPLAGPLNLAELNRLLMPDEEATAKPPAKNSELEVMNEVEADLEGYLAKPADEPISPADEWLKSRSLEVKAVEVEKERSCTDDLFTTSAKKSSPPKRSASPSRASNTPVKPLDLTSRKLDFPSSNMSSPGKTVGSPGKTIGSPGKTMGSPGKTVESSKASGSPKPSPPSACAACIKGLVKAARQFQAGLEEKGRNLVDETQGMKRAPRSLEELQKQGDDKAEEQEVIVRPAPVSLAESLQTRASNAKSGLVRHGSAHFEKVQNAASQAKSGLHRHGMRAKERSLEALQTAHKQAKEGLSRHGSKAIEHGGKAIEGLRSTSARHIEKMKAGHRQAMDGLYPQIERVKSHSHSFVKKSSGHCAVCLQPVLRPFSICYGKLLFCMAGCLDHAADTYEGKKKERVKSRSAPRNYHEFASSLATKPEAIARDLPQPDTEPPDSVLAKPEEENTNFPEGEALLTDESQQAVEGTNGAAPAVAPAVEPESSAPVPAPKKEPTAAEAWLQARMEMNRNADREEDSTASGIAVDQLVPPPSMWNMSWWRSSPEKAPADAASSSSSPSRSPSRLTKKNLQMNEELLQAAESPTRGSVVRTKSTVSSEARKKAEQQERLALMREQMAAAQSAAVEKKPEEETPTIDAALFRESSEEERLATQAAQEIEAARIAAEKETFEKEKLAAQAAQEIEAARAAVEKERREVEEKLRKKVEEEERIAAEIKANEERLAAEAAKKAEGDRLAAAIEERLRKKAEEEKRIAAEIKANEERLAAEAAKKAEEDRIAAEMKAEEARLAAEAAKKAEEERIAAEKKAEEEERIAAEMKANNERLAAEAAKKANEDRIAAEKKAEEARLAAEAAKKAEEERIAAEKKAEEDRLAAEAAKKAEEDRIIASHAALQAVSDAARRAEQECIAAERRLEEEKLAAEVARMEVRRLTSAEACAKIQEAESAANQDPALAPFPEKRANFEEPQEKPVNRRLAGAGFLPTATAASQDLDALRTKLAAERKARMEAFGLSPTVSTTADDVTPMRMSAEDDSGYQGSTDI